MFLLTYTGISEVTVFESFINKAFPHWSTSIVKLSNMNIKVWGNHCKEGCN